MSRTITLGIACLIMFGAACSFDDRSGAFACSDTNPCEDNSRVCSEGWCVVPGAATDASADGPPNAADAMVCPEACSRCEAGACVIECDSAIACAAEVRCPAGLPCLVNCTGPGACAAGIDCSTASSCVLSCSGAGSCNQELLCGAGLCDIECTGIMSCAGGLDCSDSCDCNATCPNGCGANTCPGTAACIKDDLCSNAAGACSNC